MLWLALLVGILSLPIRLDLAWRKPWGGPVVLWGILAAPGVRIRLRSRRTLWRCGPWRGKICHPKGSPVWSRATGLEPIERAWRRVRLLTWRIEVELGFQDPSQTARWRGVLAALPPAYAEGIRFTFTQVGWRGRGRIRLRTRLIWLLEMWLLGPTPIQPSGDPSNTSPHHPSPTKPIP